MPEAKLEHLVVGSMLAEMPLFLDLDRHIILPLESTYMTACRGMPAWPARSTLCPMRALGRGTSTSARPALAT